MDIRDTDSLKTLFYGKMMYIETAVKNIALESILVNSNSESIQSMYDKVVSSYKNAPSTAPPEEKKKMQENKLALQNSIQSSLVYAYRKNNPRITHFYNNVGYADVPIWALFEILDMGNLGFLLSCLTKDVREDISKRIGFNLSCDTNRVLIYKYIYTLKELRNAIAHNSVIFDTRFRNMDPNRAMKQCLMLDIGLSYVNFNTIGDYVILMCYFLKLLKVSKIEIKAFVREFEHLTDSYRNSVNSSVATIVIHPDLESRMKVLKSFL